MYRIPAGMAAALLVAAAAPRPAQAALWPLASPFDKPAPPKASTPPKAPAAAAETAAAKPPFHIKGFRSARFGMTQEQVLAAAAADFKISAGKVQVSANPQERTTILTATVDALDPGPGAATVTYVLGAANHRLVRIGVVWTRPGEPPDDDRAALVNDGMLLVNYFRGQGWTDGAIRTGVPTGANALALFVGQDPDGATVEVDIQGVSYEQQVNGKTVSSPPPKGPAALILIYTQDAAHPDIYRLPPGAF